MSNIKRKEIPFQPALDVKTTADIKHEINSIDFSHNGFISSSQNVPVVLLKGVGKFCECGCGRQIKGRWVKRKSKTGKLVSYYQKPKENERFASKVCLNKIYNKLRKFKTKNSLHCELKLKVVSDKIPYRELVVYLGEGQTHRVKITAEQKILWETLERISRYRHIPKMDNQKIEMVASIL